MSTYKRNYKTFLEENCAIDLDSYYLFTGKMLNLKLILIVLLEFSYIKTFLNFTADSMNTLQLKQMMNLTVC